MLALPHHLDLLQGAKTLDKMPGRRTGQGEGQPGPLSLYVTDCWLGVSVSATYVAMKGPMTAVVGDRWFLKVSQPASQPWGSQPASQPGLRRRRRR